jgi:hypothetical protein
MKHADRPTEMLLRQLTANRKAIRDRHPVTGKKTFPHFDLFRPAFIRDILEIRRVLRSRGIRPCGTYRGTNV